MPQYTVIEAPSPLGLCPSGVERTPEVLLQMGLARALVARRGQRGEPLRLAVRIDDHGRDLRLQTLDNVGKDRHLASNKLRA
jgi:hypothetical protein